MTVQNCTQGLGGGDAWASWWCQHRPAFLVKRGRNGTRLCPGGAAGRAPLQEAMVMIGNWIHRIQVQRSASATVQTKF